MYVRPTRGITKVDTAPLTGEPLPWSVPRKDKDGEPGSGKVTVEESVGGYEKTLGECAAQQPIQLCFPSNTFVPSKVMWAGMTVVQGEAPPSRLPFAGTPKPASK